ncbi:uncharacterized protein LOC132196742 [Neocloeon triangulifer]|uniref:uncharacterized protein LOC132196742 n=1 Tax=Neocloeon triangulifer TaxID=2078957 RepID=UPI00286F845B|nr:uncharacterized protein LOC132196742 [Neocloeon triangulifer]
MDAVVVYDDVKPGPSNAQEHDEGRVTIRLRKKREVKEQQGCSTLTLSVALALSIVFAVFSTGLLNYFLFSTKVAEESKVMIENLNKSLASQIGSAKVSFEKHLEHAAEQNRVLTQKLQNISEENQKRQIESEKSIQKGEEIKKYVDAIEVKLENVSKSIEILHQLDEIQIFVTCALARSAKLTQLSNGKRYFFSYATIANWTDAEKRCKGMGLHLATLRNETDLNATWAEAKKRTTSFWWLSAKDYGNGEKYDVRWQDGSELEENSNLWRANNVYKTGCVFFYTDNAFSKKLNGALCTTKFRFICELPSECY